MTTTTPPANTGASEVDLARTTVTSDLDDHVLVRARSGQATRYTYDTSGNLTRIISPAGATSTYTYDWLGRRLAGTDPDAGTVNSDYYPSGRSSAGSWGSAVRPTP